MSWLCTSSRRSMRASLAPTWRLKPTMSVNMMAASLRVSAVAVCGGSSCIGAIMLCSPPGCQMAHGAWRMRSAGQDCIGSDVVVRAKQKRRCIMAGSFEDKFVIQELIARYNHAIDFGNYDAWVECFTIDGIFEGTA